MTAAALPLSTAFAAKAPSTDTAQTTAVSAEETGTDTGGDLSYEEQETYSDYYDTYRDEPRPEAEILLSGADFQKADCTGYETGNIDNVMDGDLDGFLNAYLTQLATGELKK